MAGTRTDGVRDLEDLRQRSRIDSETGCWVVQARQRKGAVWLWWHAERQALSLTALMAHLMTGRKAAPGTMWVAMCGNTACGNPAHRKLGTRSLLMKVMRPELEPLHRARIQQSHLRRSKAYAPEVRAEILESDEPGAVIAKRIGVHPSVVSRVRRGETWAASAVGASVFNLGSAP